MAVAQAVAARAAAGARTGSPGLVLAAAVAGFFVAALDALVVNVALPDVGAGLHGGMTGLQWVVDGYTLMYAALMLSAGALADRFGAGRVFGGGLALFTLASAACGLAPSLGTLVAARLVQGAAASLLVPASLALVRQAYPDPERRTRAIAVWTGVGAVAAAAGPVAGGALAASLGWRSIFFINVPVGVLGLVLLSRTPGSPRRSAPLDLPGQVTGVLALAGLTYGVIDGGAHGYGSARALAALAVGALAGAVFAVVESRRERPMLPLDLFRQRVVSVPVLAGFVVNVAFYGAVFVLSLYFQQVLGMSALAAGVMFLPMTGLVAVVNLFAAARLVRRFGTRLPMVVGQAGTAVALLGLLTVGRGTPVVVLALLVVPVALAGSLAVPAMLAALMSGVAAERAGSAAAVLNTARQVGGALAVAVFGSLVAGPGRFLGGMHAAFAVSAVLLLAGAAATAALMPGRAERA